MRFLRCSPKYLQSLLLTNKPSFALRHNAPSQYQCQRRNFVTFFGRFADWKRISHYSILGILSGTIAGTFYFKYMENTTANSGEIPTQIVPSKRRIFNGGTDTNGLKLTLFQYQTCPFCCKVRAFLDFYGISYDIVEVNPVLRQQIKFSLSKKVPILIVQDKNKTQQVNDSSVIISALHSYLLDPLQALDDIVDSFPLITYTNEDGKQVTEVANRYFLMFHDRPLTRSKEDLQRERTWRQWTDSTLVHTLSPNVYREPAEALQAFEWFSQVGEWEKHFAAWERYLVIYVGAAAMYFVGKRLQKRHGLKDDVRESLYDACKEWLKEVGKNRFHGGNDPNLADLAVYGVLNAIEGCDAFKDLKANTKIGAWYERMQQVVSTGNGAHAPFS